MICAKTSPIFHVLYYIIAGDNIDGVNLYPYYLIYSYTSDIDGDNNI